MTDKHELPASLEQTALVASSPSCNLAHDPSPGLRGSLGDDDQRRLVATAVVQPRARSLTGVEGSARKCGFLHNDVRRCPRTGHMLSRSGDDGRSYRHALGRASP